MVSSEHNSLTMKGLNQRQEKIIEIARSEGFVGIDKLALLFDITPQTIRRDIGLLCDKGILRRYHGGASLISNTRNVDYTETARGYEGREGQDRQDGC